MPCDLLQSCLNHQERSDPADAEAAELSVANGIVVASIVCVASGDCIVSKVWFAVQAVAIRIRIAKKYDRILISISSFACSSVV